MLEAPDGLEGMPDLSAWLGMTAPDLRPIGQADAPFEERWARAVETNVIIQMARLAKYPQIANLLGEGMKLHGWVYDLPTAQLRVWDAERELFLAADALTTAAER